VRVGADGRTISTKLLSPLGKRRLRRTRARILEGTAIRPAIGVDGRAGRIDAADARGLRGASCRRAATASSYASMVFHFRTESAGETPADMAARIERMSCRDLLLEYDFMHGLAPKAKLHHEEIFHVAFAMLIAARRLSTESRDVLIAQWDALGRTDAGLMPGAARRALLEGCLRAHLRERRSRRRQRAGDAGLRSDASTPSNPTIGRTLLAREVARAVNSYWTKPSSSPAAENEQSGECRRQVRDQIHFFPASSCRPARLLRAIRADLFLVSGRECRADRVAATTGRRWAPRQNETFSRLFPRRPNP